MMATSFILGSSARRGAGVGDGREREGHDLVPFVVDVEGDDGELDVHAEAELGRVVLGEAGLDPHHVVEAQFKALARALRAAVARDPRVEGIPSAKGAL